MCVQLRSQATDDWDSPLALAGLGVCHMTVPNRADDLDSGVSVILPEHPAYFAKARSGKGGSRNHGRCWLGYCFDHRQSLLQTVRIRVLWATRLRHGSFADGVPSLLGSLLQCQPKYATPEAFPVFQ